MMRMVALLILLAQATTAASLKVDKKEVKALKFLQANVDHNDDVRHHTDDDTGVKEAADAASKHTNSTHDGSKGSANKTGVMVLRTRSVDLTLATEMENPWIDAVDCYEHNWEECSCGNWGRWYPDGFTPAGCVRNTLASIYALAKFVSHFGYTLQLTGGSLLGAMRCGSFIPWDYVGEMRVITGSYDEAMVLANRVNEWAGGSQKPPTIFVTVDGQHGVRNWYATHPEATINGNVHLGIYISGQLGAATPKLIPWSIPCVLNDIVVHCPANYDEELSRSYGSDWKSVPKRWESWQNSELASPIKVDIASLDACKRRMSAIDAALAKMKL